MALLQALAKRVVQAELAAPGTVVDHAFIAEHTSGYEAFVEHVLRVDDDEVLRATA